MLSLFNYSVCLDVDLISMHDYCDHRWYIVPDRDSKLYDFLRDIQTRLHLSDSAPVPEEGSGFVRD
jgi:hypothetical protein